MLVGGVPDLVNQQSLLVAQGDHVRALLLRDLEDHHLVSGTQMQPAPIKGNSGNYQVLAALPKLELDSDPPPPGSLASFQTARDVASICRVPEAAKEAERNPW